MKWAAYTDGSNEEDEDDELFAGMKRPSMLRTR
jgi:hypothetical protein